MPTSRENRARSIFASDMPEGVDLSEAFGRWVTTEPGVAATDWFTAMDEPIRITEPVPGTEPTTAPWEPRNNDMVRVTRGYADVQEGEIGYVDHVRMRGSCGDASCPECGNVASILLLRVSVPEAESPWRTQYFTVPLASIGPMLPASTRHFVRCTNQEHRGAGRWAHRFVRPNTPTRGTACTQAIRVVSDEDDVTQELSPYAEVTFAAELAQREERRQEMNARLALMRAGETYMISGMRSDYCGYLATLRGTVDPFNQRVRVDVITRAGEMVRRGFMIQAMTLGERVYSWQLGTQIPHFIQFMTPTYAGQVTLGDRPIDDSSDTHECDHACFNYGCSQRATGEEFDEEPEEYIGDVPIMNYSYVPQLRFSGQGPVFLGTELELSCGLSHSAQDALNMRKAAKVLTQDPKVGELVFLKSDGSISGVGFEAVFHPMSYDWLVENWPEDLLRRMRECGAMPHSSCGMHVHVSRAGFSDSIHAYKWIKFMYRNAREMSRMARRDPTSWGGFDRPSERAAAKWHAKGGYGAENRYTAVNCIPRNTFEVRIFASTLNRTRFLGSLGLVDASVEYTRQLSTETILKANGWAFPRFREWVSDFDKYMPLRKEIERLIDN